MKNKISKETPDFTKAEIRMFEKAEKLRDKGLL